MGSTGEVRDGSVLVTGATGGIGYFVAEQLAQQGRRVLLAARHPGRAEAAVESIRRHAPGADLHVIPLDLADLASVARAVELVDEPLAALVCNAAVVSYGLRPAPPQLTADGLEVHLGTAFLGHYALVARLLPRLEAWGTRIVHCGSLSQRVPAGRDPWSRLEHPRREPSFTAYARSKQAVALFGMALASRLSARGSAAGSVLAHPGVAVDVNSPVRDGIPPSQPTDLGALDRWMMRGVQGKDGGAAILVHAATAPEVGNGQLWGPDGRWHVSGPPVRQRPPRPPRDRSVTGLLRTAERLSGLALD